MSRSVLVYTDGSCLDNPGPGGWAAVVRSDPGGQEVLSGGVARTTPEGVNTTNNRMELTAAIKALESLPEPSSVTLVSDSKYVVDGITDWIHGWKRNNWVNSSKKPVENKDLWVQLEAAAGRHDVEWKWVKGHHKDRLNNLCDELANKAAEAMGRLEMIPPGNHEGGG